MIQEYNSNEVYQMVYLCKLPQSKKIHLPKDWTTRSIGDVADINSEMIDARYTHKSILYVDISSIENYAIQNYEKFVLDERPSRAQRIIKNNDILVSTVRPYLRGFTQVRSEEDNLVCSTGFTVVRPHNKDEGNFIFNYIMSYNFEVNIIRHMEGMAYPAVTSKIVSNSPIPWPNDRVKIEKIGVILSKVSDLIQKIDQLIRQIQKVSKGLNQKLLTKGIEHQKFRQVLLSRLPQSKEISIPTEWEVKRINQIAKINPENIDSNYSQEEIEYIDIGSIENFQVQNYEVFKLHDRPSRAQRIVRKNDILVSTVRPYLKANAIVTKSNKNLICSTGFAVIRAIDESHMNLIFNYIKNYHFEVNVIRLMEGMAYPAITSEMVGNSILPYPNDKEERSRLNLILCKMESQLQNYRSQKSMLKNLKSGLMQKLLTGRIGVTL